MKPTPPAPWTPIAVFLMAVGGALAFQKSPSALALRPAGMPTSSCDHTKFLSPGDVNGTTRSVDGSPGGVLHPQELDFVPFPPADYASQLTAVTKTTDGSVALHIGKKGNEDTDWFQYGERIRVVAFNTANSGFVRSSGSPADCCHDIRFQHHGLFRARLSVSGPIDLGSSGSAIVGSAAPGEGDDPVAISTDLDFDVNCNGVRDALRHRVSADVRLSAFNRAPGRPPYAIFVGFQQGSIQEITDGTGIEYGPRRTLYLSFGFLPNADGVEESISRPLGFTQQSKRFRETARNSFSVRSAAAVAVSRVVRFRDYPQTEVDLSIDVAKHFSEDVPEAETAEIKKSFR